jgi:hypothetical protein
MRLIKILLLLLLLIPSCGFSADLYIGQSTAGDDSGSSCANQKAISYLTGSWAGKVAAGDTVHLCGTLTSQLVIGASGTSGNLITIKFESGAKFSAPYWSTTGAIYMASKSYITVDGGANGIIENTDNGSALGNQAATAAMQLDRCTNVEIKNLRTQNIYVHDYSTTVVDTMGVPIYGIHLLNSSDVSVHDCTMIQGYNAVSHSHTLGGTISNISIYNNTISHQCHGITLSGGNNSTTSNAQVYNNDIEMGSNWTSLNGGNCHLNGTFLYPSVSNTWKTIDFKYYNNFTYGPSGTGETWISSDLLRIESLGESTGTMIYNNIFYGGTNIGCLWSQCGATNGLIAITGAGEVAPQIYNNTLVNNYSSGASGGVGIRYGSLNGNGAPIIKNNIIQTCVIGVYTSTIGDVPELDNNSYYDLTYLSNLRGIGAGYFTFSQMSQMRTALGGCPNSGNECLGITTNPDLNSNFTPKITSTVIDSGANLTSLEILTLNIDKSGVARSSSGAWDIGAYEYTGESTYYNVTPSASLGGSISPDTVISVASGGSTQLTYTANEGYAFASWGGTCGGSGTTIYTTNAITGDCTVTATFSDATSPTTTISTSNSTIIADSLTVTGTSVDAVGVSGCKFRIGSAPDASNGTACTGTTSFSCATSGYASGANTLYVGCYDAAGNYGSDSIVVIFAPPTASGCSFSGGGMMR